MGRNDDKWREISVFENPFADFLVLNLHGILWFLISFSYLYSSENLLYLINIFRQLVFNLPLQQVGIYGNNLYSYKIHRKLHINKNKNTDVKEGVIVYCC